MVYSIRDVIGFPPPNEPMRVMDWQTICDMADASIDVPIVYAFGGNAPTTVKLVNGAYSSADTMGMSKTLGSARVFQELRPYYWNQLSPDWDGVS